MLTHLLSTYRHVLDGANKVKVFRFAFLATTECTDLKCKSISITDLCPLILTHVTRCSLMWHNMALHRQGFWTLINIAFSTLYILITLAISPTKADIYNIYY